MIKFFKKSHEKYNWVDHKNNFIGYEVHCETIKHAYIYNLKELDDLSDLFGEEVEISNFDLEYIIEENKRNDFSFGNYGIYRKEIFYIEILSKSNLIGYIIIYNFHDGLYYNLIEGNFNNMEIYKFL